MSKFVILTLASALLFCAFSGMAIAGEINWLTSMSDGITLAKSSGKPIMVDFYTDWCGWCKKLDKDTYTNSTVQALAEKFVCVKVDADKDRASAEKYGVSGFPTIIFLDKDGKEIDRITGYEGPEAFAETMKKIVK